MPQRHRVLIEDHLSIETIGAESQRERGASSALPPLNFLHVWWARRPLAVSRAAILGSVLPAWSSSIEDLFPDPGAYEKWFLQLMGVFGDPAATRRALRRAKDTGEKLGPNPYGYKRAFTTSPDHSQLEDLRELLRRTWGTEELSVLDSFAGGGSIPFEAARYGFDTYANELNPVAAVILMGTLKYPLQYGDQLVPLIRKYGRLFCDELENRLGEYFPAEPGTRIFAYVWARTVPCPFTGKPVPLSPNWWLFKGSSPVAVQPTFGDHLAEAEFRIVKGTSACARIDASKGTTSRRGPISPWASDQGFPWTHVREEARAGRMKQALYAIAFKTSRGLEFRTPAQSDLEAAADAERAYDEQIGRWERSGLALNEEIPVGQETHDHKYGVTHWKDMFSKRQLLSLYTALEVLETVCESMRDDIDDDLAAAVQTYLGFAIDKAADYNSRMARWHSGRGVVANTFDRHDFGFKWSHAEFDSAHNLFPWAIDQVADAVAGIVGLRASHTEAEDVAQESPVPERVRLAFGSAASLHGVGTGSIHAVVVDPPYYDNVQYSECSDFFYIWQKRSIGALYPEWFRDELTNKDDEAVSNSARFADMGRRRAELAEQDYERKMQACFREMHRVLSDDGVLTVMFTHKKVKAWDTLGMALIEAGFAVHSSWPVHTESEHSLHQAKKNAAASTILLTCRKRRTSSAPVWWDDIKNQVRETARERAAEYEKQGIRGVDLYIATFGPVLAVISETWPVLTSELDERTGQARPLRPEAALEIAREEVVGLRKRGLLLGRNIEFDTVSDWYLMAWDAFRAEEFPGDEARKLAIALGLGLEDTLIKAKKVVTKKSKNVVLQMPSGRQKRGCVDTEADAFECVLDAAHTAMLVFDEDGARACERWLRQRGLDRDDRLKAFLQAMVNAVASQKKKGAYIRPEMATLDRMNDALGLELTFPVEREYEREEQQGMLFDADTQVEDDE